MNRNRNSDLDVAAAFQKELNALSSENDNTKPLTEEELFAKFLKEQEESATKAHQEEAPIIQVKKIILTSDVPENHNFESTDKVEIEKLKELEALDRIKIKELEQKISANEIINKQLLEKINALELKMNEQTEMPKETLETLKPIKNDIEDEIHVAPKKNPIEIPLDDSTFISEQFNTAIQQEKKQTKNTIVLPLEDEYVGPIYTPSSSKSFKAHSSKLKFLPLLFIPLIALGIYFIAKNSKKSTTTSSVETPTNIMPTKVIDTIINTELQKSNNDLSQENKIVENTNSHNIAQKTWPKAEKNKVLVAKKILKPNTFSTAVKPEKKVEKKVAKSLLPIVKELTYEERFIKRSKHTSEVKSTPVAKQTNTNIAFKSPENNIAATTKINTKKKQAVPIIKTPAEEIESKINSRLKKIKIKNQQTGSSTIFKND